MLTNYWLYKRMAKQGWVGVEWDFMTEGLCDTINEKREVLFVKCLQIYRFLECKEIRISPEIADIFFDHVTGFWPERDQYPQGEDGPRLLPFTTMNMLVYKDCPKDLIIFTGPRYFENLRITNLFENI